MTRTSRREFAKTLTAAGAAAIVASDLTAQTPPAAPPPAPPSKLAEALTQVVRAQSGQYLSDDEVERIGKDFQDLMPAIDRLRQFPLVNSDEPDITFSASTRRW